MGNSTHYQNSIISKYFTEKLEKHCEFVQDKETMYLKIGNEVIKKERLYKGTEVADIEKIISFYESVL